MKDVKEARVKKIARKNILRKSKPFSGKGLIKIKGPDLSKKISIEELIESYGSIGFQASNLGKAIKIIKKMRKENARIFLAYSSNMVSSGLREIIAYLVKNKMVHVLVTTAGGIEEDIIKTMKPFYLGDFRASGAKLRNAGVNRIGNIFVPNSHYVKLDVKRIL